MSLIKNIVLKDGQAVPADHTFVPACPQVGDKTPATWFEKNANSPIGWRKITLLVRPVPNGTSKVTIRVSDPTLALTADGCCVDVNTPVVSYTDIFSCEFSLPYKATKANRADILAFAKGFLGDAVVTAAVEELELVW